MFGDFLFTKALIASFLCGFFLPYLGRSLVLSRMVLLGLVIPQFAMAGMAFVYFGHAHEWWGFSRLETDLGKTVVGALLFTLPSLLLMAVKWRNARENREVTLAVLYVAAAAFTQLLLVEQAVAGTYLSDLLHGSLLLISDEGFWLLSVVLVLGGGLFFLARKRFLLGAMESDFARVAGVSLGLWLSLQALGMGVTIAVSVATAGPMVTFGFLILPVVAGKFFAKSLRVHALLASGLGVFTAGLGFAIAYHANLPLGDTLLAVASILLLVCWLLRMSWACWVRRVRD